MNERSIAFKKDELPIIPGGDSMAIGDSLETTERPASIKDDCPVQRDVQLTSTKAQKI